MKYIIAAEIFVKLINFLFLPFFVINMTPDEFSNFNIAFAQVAFFSFLIGGGAFNVYASEVSNSEDQRAVSTIIKLLFWWGTCSVAILYLFILILQLNDWGNFFYNTSNHNIYNYLTVLVVGQQPNADVVREDTIKS